MQGLLSFTTLIYLKLVAEASNILQVMKYEAI